MGKVVAFVVSFIGTALALTSSSMCIWAFLDEVETPNSLIR